LQLRSELSLEVERGNAAGTLRDPLFGRTVTLGPTSVALSLALEEPRELDLVLAMLQSGGYAREKIEDALRLFTLLHLIDGIGDDVRARIAGIWAGDVELPHRAIPGARHACQGSGKCCRSYRLGPVEPAEAAVISGLPIHEAMPDLPEGEPFGMIDGRLYLRTVDTHCLFLRDDHRCGLHAHFGEDVKPLVCREYPISIKATFREAVVYNNHQCASHFVAQDAGPPLVDAARLTGRTLSGKITLFHPIVFAREDTPVDYAQFLELEAALRDVMGTGAPLEQLAHCVSVLDSFVDAARQLPLGEDPMPHVARWRASVPLVARAPGPAPTAAELRGTIELLDILVQELMQLLVDPERARDIDAEMVPLVKQLLPCLAEVQLRAQKLKPGVRAEPLREPLASALRTSLVQRFQGPLSLPDDRPLSAIGQAALAVAVAFAGARELDLASLGPGHALANRVLPAFTPALFRGRPDYVRALVAVLPALCAARS
jgi:Fe-S-cluster containining protein